MTPVEIEEAVEKLIEQPFDRDEFPFQFLLAFDTSDAAIRRLKAGSQNQSDIGGVLNRNNIHIATCDAGAVDDTITALRDSPKTTSAKAKFVLATDGETIQAENMSSGEPLVCKFAELPDHFGFFLQLAGITTVKEIEESSFDIRATGRLNKLYVRLLEDNPDWASDERRPDMNHFMARLIFCFFAEDTDIFVGEGLFTKTVQQMSSSDASDAHTIISECFRSMDTKLADREKERIPRYANQFPYVNGQLFSGDVEVPRFSKIARSYLIHIGNLDWTKINPDIFGSMIQAVADDEERGSLGMHYTSVPNILKVLNPLFLDDLREQLDAAGDNDRKLLNLRKRMSKIRVFDPACGSGNFLVIAYKEMRSIEAAINERRGEPELRSTIPLTNFRGIELRDFPAEIARLALIIAEYQCDVTYRGQQEALAEFLPLDSKNWITCGNALRLDWLSVCEPTGQGGSRIFADDLYGAPLDQAKVDFQNDGGETYICGNPPYLGGKWQSEEQKHDLLLASKGFELNWKSLDYVAGWFLKAADYIRQAEASVAFVATNSIAQGQQVPILWKPILGLGCQIGFAHTSFVWSNLAQKNAGVIVVIVGFSLRPKAKFLFGLNSENLSDKKLVDNISPYLTDSPSVFVEKATIASDGRGKMLFGNMPRDGGHLLLSPEEKVALDSDPHAEGVIRRYVGSEDMIQGKTRYCIWCPDQPEPSAHSELLADRFEKVAEERSRSRAASTRTFAKSPHRFVQIQGVAKHQSLVIPRVSSERRRYLPIGLFGPDTIVADSAFALYDVPLWYFSVIASRLHLVWIGAVCGKLKNDFRYSNTIGWNTFPLPRMTEKLQLDLEAAANAILLAREHHYPATIAELYAEGKMPDDLRIAHELNDEVLERAYIGRVFRNDTERLSRLLQLYERGGGST